MSQEIVVITGAPSSGKTTLINELKEQGFYCFEEISRKITLEAQKKRHRSIISKTTASF